MTLVFCLFLLLTGYCHESFLILAIALGAFLTFQISSKKKGNKTDYVKRQYIGNPGKIGNGIVAVTAYGLVRGMTFPLIPEVYKPRERLKEGDQYKSKPKIGGEIKVYKRDYFWEKKSS